MTASFVRRLSAALVAFAFAPLALAHPEGHGAHDFVAGFAHPFTGIDHLLAMIAVGLWAVRLGRRAVWTLPIVFPLAMLIGAAAGANGIGLPAIEPMIAISVIVLGALVAAGMRMPVVASAVLVGVFAIFHGYAHAVEAPASTLGVYAAGFVSATVTLHVLGVAAGALLARQATPGAQVQVGRVAGSLIAVTGAVLLLF